MSTGLLGRPPAGTSPAGPPPAPAPATTSCVYEGWVRHRRYGDVEHELRYPLFMVYLDLAELDTVFRRMPLWSTSRPALARLRRTDHLGDPTQPLDESVRALVAERTGERPAGPIRLLTNLRYAGICFNPVSFYYCFAPDGNRLQAVVAEVTNTPWGERHAYVMRADPDRPAGRILHGRMDKDFHVSPFMGMDHTYDWRLTNPADRLTVNIDSERDGVLAFDATLSLERRPITTGILIRHPGLTLRVVAQIYIHALRLRLKHAKYFPNPSGAPILGRARRASARTSRETLG
ncbi:MAG TPA: DUF1365 domain-containing protein [Solirubrobacteraceae bacterium]|nr:DUF1365 domain-containing protein [Solirubrobacteraceae bacterium]